MQTKVTSQKNVVPSSEALTSNPLYLGNYKG